MGPTIRIWVSRQHFIRLNAMHREPKEEDAAGKTWDALPELFHNKEWHRAYVKQTLLLAKACWRLFPFIKSWSLF